MEKIKVNMTPNPLDVQTIHASQNDGEARQWEFELHNNGELIDTSDVKERLVFKAYKGGTEQILPENTSTPTTSPFKGDIRYPQGLLTDQEFTYRQSPSESDGLAKITDIKGNTLVWNQLIASNETINLNRDSARTYNISTNNTRSVVGHKYYFATTITSDNTNRGLNCRFGSDFNVGKGVGRHSITFTANDTNNASIYCYIQSNEESGTALSFKDTVLIDLTLMGLADKTDDEIKQWFTDYYPLPYYDYNAGTLLSFNGTGIKTANEDESQEHTTTLPIATYFPTGMKSAGGVYDELTPTKAFSRIGAVDLGSLTWTKQDLTTGNFYRANVSGRIYGTNAPGGLCAKYEWALNGTTSVLAEQLQNKQIGYQTTNTFIWIRDDDYSDATTFKNSLQGQYLYYELATPTETSFTTASLVTENAEIPLSNNDGTLIGKCTEQLSENPGFIDAKIKLSDADGECYSNKLQLHVERSPQ